MNIVRERDSILIQFENEKVASFNIANKSLMNKVNFLLDDIEEIYNLDNSFSDFFLNLKKYIKTGLVLFNKNEVLENLSKYSKLLVNKRISEPEKFCDQTKRTKDSIFFDINEMTNLLELIGVFKIIGLMIHSSMKQEFSQSIQELLTLVAENYSNVNRKLYQVITSKTLKGSLANKHYMNFLKFSLDYDYLILYNFSFITNVLICLYNWSKNPVSYIVSLASENFNYLIMTYSTIPVTYTNEELNIDISSGDFLDSISYEMILQNIFEKQQKENITIKDYHTTPITDILALPLFSYMTDIDIRYLEGKSNYDKLCFQYLVYKFLVKNKLLRQKFPDLMKNALKLFAYGFEIPIQYGEGIIPAMLEVLKQDFSYYGLSNKIPVLNSVRTFSCFINKRKHLRNLTSGQPITPEINKNIQDYLKYLVQLTLIILSDEYRDEIKKELKLQFIQYLGSVKLNKMTLGLYL